MLRSYKYQLDLNNKQKDFLEKSFGCCRFVYNYALYKKIRAYKEDNKRLTAYDLMKQLTGWKKEDDKLWLNEVVNLSLQQSIMNMDNAFTNFFRNKKGFPKFKKKGQNDSCKFIQSVYLDFEKQKIKIPKMGWCNFFCDRKFKGKQGTITISKNNVGKYFVSILVDNGIELPKKHKIEEKTSIGLDLGLKHFLTFSNGEKIDNPRFFEKSEKKLKVLQKRLSKKKKSSNRRRVAKFKLAKLHYKITCQRNDFLHKLSSKIICENQTIILEDLDVQGMMGKNGFGKSIGSVGWSEFNRQIEYKGLWNGNNIIRIGRFEPSSKLCSCCGFVNRNLKLSDREWVCPECLTKHDRDVNASINIKSFGLVPQNLIGNKLIKNTGDGIAEENMEILQ